MYWSKIYTLKTIQFVKYLKSLTEVCIKFVTIIYYFLPIFANRFRIKTCWIPLFLDIIYLLSEAIFFSSIY